MSPETNPETNPPAASVPPESKTVGYCRACGKALDAATARTAQGTLFCEAHSPAQSSAGAEPPSPWTAPASRVSQPPPLPPPHATHGGPPVLAFLLGWIPGVGAIYNGQYAKGFIHVVIFGLLINILSSNATGGFEPLFGLLIAGFSFYMAFEAYHTAKKQAAGEPVDEWSGLVTARGGSKIPAGPIVLIVIGVAFLLNNLGLFEIRRVIRYWPALLIVLGVYLLWSRLTERKMMETKSERQ